MKHLHLCISLVILSDTPVSWLYRCINPQKEPMILNSESLKAHKIKKAIGIIIKWSFCVSASLIILYLIHRYLDYVYYIRISLGRTKRMKKKKSTTYETSLCLIILSDTQLSSLYTLIHIHISFRKNKQKEKNQQNEWSFCIFLSLLLFSGYTGTSMHVCKK